MSTISEPKQDLRVTRTHRALVNALFFLLEKESFQKITVNELCETAMVSRATFYLHFEDKYHLLRFALERTRTEIAAELGEGCREQIIRRTLDHILAHKKVFRNLLLEDSNQELTKMLNGLFVQQFTSELEKKQCASVTLPFPPQLVAIFIAGGITNLLIWWINDGFTISPDEMTTQLTLLAQKQKAFDMPLLPEPQP